MSKEANYNIINYVEDNNASLDTEGFNEIDGLVLTQVSNMRLDDAGIGLNSGTSKTFAEIKAEMNTPGNTAYSGFSDNDRRLINALGDSPRFRNMDVSDFVHNPAQGNVPGFDSVGPEIEKEQFAAATITYHQNGKEYHYVSYRATESGMDGWLEDLEMLYTPDTQAQNDSKVYMNMIGKKTTGTIVGGGHSKGGNDFEYAYLFCDEDVKQRIEKGYVYDNPGMNNETLAQTDRFEDYKRITDGTNYCPQDSIIGQLLIEAGNAQFVHSSESGFFEHDPYSWEIDKDKHKFVPDEQSEGSKYINESLDRAVAGMTPEERRAFFTLISTIIANTGCDNMDDLIDFLSKGWTTEDGDICWEKVGKAYDILRKSWKSMSKEEKKAFIRSCGDLIAGFISTAFDRLKDKVKNWIEDRLTDIKNGIINIAEGIKDWVTDRFEDVKEFFTTLAEYTVEAIKKLADWWNKHFNAGVKYSDSHTCIRVDTSSLRAYADRLYGVNSRIVNLDNRMDALYRKLSVIDQFRLQFADMGVGSNKFLTRSADYLNETASLFESAENDICGNI